MKKILSILMTACLLLGVLPLVLADEDDVTGGITIDIDDDNTAPEIYTDSTQRSWFPNDQTFYTAELYSDGGVDTNNYCDDFYDVGVRGDYVFAGEVVTYYVLVEDADGENDIDTVQLQVDDSGLIMDTACIEIDPLTELLAGCGVADWVDGVTTLEMFDNIDPATVFDDATMNVYRCRLIVPATAEIDGAEVNVVATDENGLSATTTWSDFLTLNPALTVTLGGAFAFGSANAGTTVTSSTVQLTNVGDNGVVMDMYVASDDFFTDPTGLGTCGAFGPGIPYDSFSYYASKGSVDSGDNDNSEPGLGEAAGGLCEADDDEYTPMPSHSGDIDDMCRIINHQEDGSFLTQGQSMNVRLQLDIPSACNGAFTTGNFHFVGRVI